MITTLIYILIATAAATVFFRLKSWKGWSVDSRAAATIGFGLFWPFSVPMAGVILCVNKVLDKFAKV